MPRASGSRPIQTGSFASGKRRRKIMVVAAASLLAVGAVVLLVVVQSDDSEPQIAGAPSSPAIGGGSAGAPSLASRSEPVGRAAGQAPSARGPAAAAPTDAAASPNVIAAQAAPGARTVADAGVAATSSGRDGGTGGQRGSSGAAAARVAAAPSKARPADAGVASAPDAGKDAGKKMVAEAPRSRSASSDEDDRGTFTRVARFVASGGALLEGKIVDGDSGRPLSGAYVEARYTDRFVETTADSSGAFRMPGMAPHSSVVVWVGGKRDRTVAERLEVTIPGEGKTADLGVIKLLNGDELGSRLDGWIGLWVTRAGEQVKVSAVNSWGPADRAGIVVGDVITSVEGRVVKGLGPRSVGFLLRGPTGSSMTLEVQSSGGARRKLTLERIRR